MDVSVTTPLAAFVTGLATSFHCAVMCGPLACALRVKPARYHWSRIGSYSIGGASCGAAGQSAALLIRSDFARIAPWALAAVLLAMAFGLDKRLPQPRGLFARLPLRYHLGWITPLIPCGPLWLMLGVAVITASWLGGALMMASFAAGTIPLYWLIQSQLFRLQGRFTPATLRYTQQSLAFLAAMLLVWRAMLPANGSCH